MKKILFCGLILGVFITSPGWAATCDDGYYVSANGGCVACPKTQEIERVLQPYVLSGEYISGMSDGGGDSVDKCQYITSFKFKLDKNTTLSSLILLDVYGNVLSAVRYGYCGGDFYSRTPEWDYFMFIQADMVFFDDNPIEAAKELFGIFILSSDVAEQFAERFVANASLWVTGPLESIEAVKDVNTSALCVHKSDGGIPDGFLMGSIDVGFMDLGWANIGMPCALVFPMFTHSDGTRTDSTDCFALTTPGEYFNVNMDMGTLEINECPAGYYCPGNVRFGLVWDDEIGGINLKSTGHFACNALPGEHDVSPDNATSAPGAINSTDCYVEVGGGESGTFNDESGTYISGEGMCYYRE